MKEIILMVLMFFGFMSAHAYIKTGDQNIGSLGTTLQKAKRQGLGLSRREVLIKKDLEAQRKKDPAAFSERVFEGAVSNPDNYQSYLLEVLVGKSSVEKAKVLAQYQILQAVEKDWEILKTTTLNESGYDNFSAFRPVLIERISALLFTTNAKTSEQLRTTDFSFRLDDWAFVVVSRDLKKVSWKLTVNAQNDLNKLEPGAETIRTTTKPAKENSGFDTDSLDDSDELDN